MQRTLSMPSPPLTNRAQLLPQDRSFQALLPPYLAPYLAYVALSSVPESLLPAELAQGIKLLATAAVMLGFCRQYRFNALQLRDLLVALLALPVALCAWVGPFYLIDFLGLFRTSSSDGVQSFSASFFYLRLLNSVILVAIFEELFIRVYVLGWLHQAGQQPRSSGAFTAILDVFEQRPAALTALPLSIFSVIGATIVFTAGHQVAEYPSAILYFLFTTWLYAKTRSLWVCILVHGLVNLSIGFLVRYAGMAWLW